MSTAARGPNEQSPKEERILSRSRHHSSSSDAINRLNYLSPGGAGLQVDMLLLFPLKTSISGN